MSRRAKVILTAAAAIAVGLIVWAIVGAGGGPSQGPHTVTVELGGPGHKKIPLTPAAQQQLEQKKQQDAAGQDAKAESDLHETQPPTAAELDKAKRVTPPGAPVIPQSPTFASPSTPGCRDAFVRNYSSRPAGARVLIGVIHWTGSKPLPGTADVYAIDRWFDTPAAQASSNYITDDEGHCLYAVPETRKAWTQANANPWAVSVEHVNQGVLPVFPTKAGKATVVRLMRGWHKRWRIPYQLGRVNSSCVPTRPGFLAHRDLGACGGGHPDIGVPSAVPALIRAAKAGAKPKPKVPSSVVTWCRRLNWERGLVRTGKPHKPTAEQRSLARQRKALIAKHGYTCTSRGLARK